MVSTLTIVPVLLFIYFHQATATALSDWCLNVNGATLAYYNHQTCYRIPSTPVKTLADAHAVCNATGGILARPATSQIVNMLFADMLPQKSGLTILISAMQLNKVGTSPTTGWTFVDAKLNPLGWSSKFKFSGVAPLDDPKTPGVEDGEKDCLTLQYTSASSLVVDAACTGNGRRALCQYDEPVARYFLLASGQQPISAGEDIIQNEKDNFAESSNHCSIRCFEHGLCRAFAFNSEQKLCSLLFDYPLASFSSNSLYNIYGKL